MSEALWAHRISKHRATKVSPFEHIYGQDAMLPVEVNLDAYRFAKQNDLNIGEYHDLMMDNIDEVTDKRLLALKEIDKDKLTVAKAYNKKVKAKNFQIGELVWKWSLGWEGPYKVKRVVPSNAYVLEDLEGNELSKALNGRFLKKYYPSMWQDA